MRRYGSRGRPECSGDRSRERERVVPGAGTGPRRERERERAGGRAPGRGQERRQDSGGGKPGGGRRRRGAQLYFVADDRNNAGTYKNNKNGNSDYACKCIASALLFAVSLSDSSHSRFFLLAVFTFCGHIPTVLSRRFYFILADLL